MSFLALKLVSGVIVAGSAIAIPLITTYSREGEDVSSNPHNFRQQASKQKCFLINTSINSDNLKLVICEDSHYYLVDKDKSFLRVKSVQSTEMGGQIKVTLEKSDEIKTLTFSDNKWNNFPKNTSLQRVCNLDNRQGEKPFLSCLHSSNRQRQEKIDLTIFNS